MPLWQSNKRVEFTYVARGCEIHNEERDALDMRKIAECDMEKFGPLDK